MEHYNKEKKLHYAGFNIDFTNWHLVLLIGHIFIVNKGQTIVYCISPT